MKKLNNGLTQGSVLAPLVLNFYIVDMLHTQSKKFGYANDSGVTTNTKNFKEIELTLTADPETRKWGLQPNANNTKACCFWVSKVQPNDTM